MKSKKMWVSIVLWLLIAALWTFSICVQLSDNFHLNVLIVLQCLAAVLSLGAAMVSLFRYRRAKENQTF